jgi:tRNA dimethylallyltransferase
VTEGWFPPEVEPDERLRSVLEKLKIERGEEWLYEKLRFLDPEAADRIDSRNVRRTIRALEVIFTTGRKFSAQRGQADSPYWIITIGLTRPRQELYERVDARIDSMFSAGLLDEVRRLLDKGYLPELPSMSGIGYRECVSVLRGEINEEEAKFLMRRATRVFVRRQANWFKTGDASIHWFPVKENTTGEICIFLRDMIDF